MATHFRPAEPDQVRDALAWAVSEETPVEITGAGSKRALGRPTNCEVTLELADLSGIIFYEPAELVLSARAGTPMAEIEAALADGGQQLGFEPPDLGPLLGGPAGAGTIGGVVACNLSGPRRVKAGAARDHFLGFQAVNGRGEAFKSGGKVVKNVTGYDLCKLLAGSYGTLAALTEITMKVLPTPEKTRTVLAFGLDDAAAVDLLGAAARSAHEPSALAHLPAPVAARSAVDYVSGAGAAVTAVRLEGPAPSVEYRCAQLRALFGATADVEELHGHNSGALWREVGDVAPFTGDSGRAVWKLSLPPTAAAAAVAAIGRARAAEWYYDWAGGLVWLACGSDGDGGAAAVRAAVADSGGHATLIRASADLRAAVPVFQPQPDAVANLSARVKNGFDPKGLLNPGRMYAGV